MTSQINYLENDGNGVSSMVNLYQTPYIIVVDDEDDIRSLICDILDDEGYQTHGVGSAKAFHDAVAQKVPDMVVLDIWLENSDQDGIGILQEFKAAHPDVPVVMISGHGNIETAVEAIKYGAYDFIEKPFKSDRLLLLAQRALEAHALAAENKSLKQKIEGPSSLVGESNKMVALRQVIERVAPTNSRVLITGEAGVGKNVVARVIHQLSKRSQNAFLSLNCAVLRPEHLEQELFGIEDGGRITQGVLEKAHGGTLLLDEIADMPMETQSKIIRVIQDQSFRRVGGVDEVDVDVRILASTNRDLEKTMEQGDFRQDLYYRLNVVPIDVPPLRLRQSDIPLLCDHFIDQYAQSSKTPARRLNDAALMAIQGYHWPGNVRQLKNAIEWVLIMASGPVEDQIRPDQLPPDIIQTKDIGKTKTIYSQDLASLSLKEAREQFEREYLQMQISRFQGNISKTAAFIGMERSALHRKLKSLDLKPSSHHNEMDSSLKDDDPVHA